MVVGLAIGDSAKAYSVQDLQDARLVNDTVGGMNVVVVASPESRAGRIYERGELTFAPVDDDNPDLAPAALVDDTGVRWTVTEEALIADADPAQRLPRIPSITSFWFGWFQYHPTRRFTNRTGSDFKPPLANLHIPDLACNNGTHKKRECNNVSEDRRYR